MQQQPCSSSEMQTISALLNAGGASSNQIQIPNFAPTSPPDDFLDQMLSSLPPWTDLKSDASLEENNGGFHYDGGGNGSAAAVKMMMQQQQQQLMMQRNDVVNGFKSSNHQGGDSSAQALFNGFGGGSVPAPNQLQNFDHSRQQVNNSGAAAAAGSVSNGGAAAAAGQPRQRVRARRGQATDPHSIAERLRRERIAERMRALQELVPNANKTDKASMLDEIVDYVKFLQLQVKVLSMSRLGGASAVAPLVADMSSEGDCIQTSANGTQTASTNDNLTVTENQVIRLMEDDMGTAMQYLQGKGLCLMPISLATTISAATCRNPITANHNGNHQLFDGGDGPCSPSMSVLTVQSNTMGPGGLDGSGKDAASVSKP